MLTLVLTRHGLTPRSLPEQHLGQRIDIEFSDAGRAQAEALANRVRGFAFERVIASPLRRAQETARIVAPRLGAPVEVETDARLVEMDYGAWEGLTYAQIDERDAERATGLGSRPGDDPLPGRRVGQRRGCPGSELPGRPARRPLGCATIRPTLTRRPCWPWPTRAQPDPHVRGARPADPRVPAALPARARST